MKLDRGHVPGLSLGSANVNGFLVQQFACDLEIKLFFVSLKT